MAMTYTWAPPYVEVRYGDKEEYIPRYAREVAPDSQNGKYTRCHPLFIIEMAI